MSSPPPPPPGQPDWPASRQTVAATSPTTASARQPWWTGGRIALAIVIVLVLMGAAGFAGFLAGMAVGGFESFVGDGTFDLDEGFGGDVPGVVPLDATSVPGPVVRRGDSTDGTLAGEPVDHPLTVETGGPITIEVTADDFDSVLVVLDENGGLLASDDDGAGLGTDSRLELDLGPGSYTVRVQSWGSEGSGTYTVSVD